LKRTLLFSFLPIMFTLAGCLLPQRENVRTPDERAGPNLVIYFAEKADTRRTARAIAEKTGGELFDLGGKKPLPNLFDYETFFVGAPSAEGRIAAVMENFLSRTDFMDGRVIPFWTSRENTENLNGDFERLLWGARFLPGGGFLLTNRIKAKAIALMAGEWAESMLTELGLRRTVGDQAEDMVKIFLAAYGGRLGPAIFQDGDWTFEMDGVRWYYAQGRFLPEEDAEKPEDFRPLFLYRYQPEPPSGGEEVNPWQEVANKTMSRRTSRSSQSAGSLGRNLLASNLGATRPPFYEAVWRTRTRTEAAAQQQWVAFLGRKVQIHRDIAEPLSRVEARIQDLAETNEEIVEWMKTLQSITGWNWRNIAGSESRSFHAYGVAVDLLQKTQAGMETYWQWTASKGIDWRTVPRENRQNPPPAVIRAFEEQGFIWGGRWSRYDTMHFEYHPELLILGTGRDSTPPSGQSASYFVGNSW
jgi:hypothetical protein